MLAHITFTHLVVNATAHGVGAHGSHRAAEAFFRLEMGNQSFPDASVRVLRPSGSTLDSDVFEVSEVRGSYRGGGLDRADFRDHVESYVRDLISAHGCESWLGANAGATVTECMSEERECWIEISD